MRRRERTDRAQPWLAGISVVALAFYSIMGHGVAAGTDTAASTPSQTATADSTTAGIGTVASTTDSTGASTVPWFKQRRLWIIAGALTVAAVVVAVAVSDDDEESPERLPGFPPPP